MLTLRAHNPTMTKSLVSFALKIQNTFGDRLVALYIIARHPSIEIDGYNACDNALIMLKEVKPEDQRRAINLTLDSCKDLNPEEQIAPLVVGEGEVEGEISLGAS